MFGKAAVADLVVLTLPVLLDVLLGHHRLGTAFAVGTVIGLFFFAAARRASLRLIFFAWFRDCGKDDKIEIARNKRKERIIRGEWFEQIENRLHTVLLPFRG